MITSYLRWLFIAIITILLAIPTFAISIVSPRFANMTTVKLWGKLIILACGVKLTISGLENIKNQPTIVMYNHKSFFDIFAFCSFMRYDWRAMMKKELGKIPVFGQVSKAMGHYFVARDGSFEDRREVVKVLKEIRNGKIVFIAPEGTRNPNPGLIDFKNGGFYIARKTKINIVPMIIQGAGEIIEKNSIMIKPGSMNIKILPEISVETYGEDKESLANLKDDVYKIFLENI